MKRIIEIFLMFFLFFSNTLLAEGDYNGVHFTDYEETATLYFVNYYGYQDYKDIYISSTDSRDIIKERVDGLYSSIDDFLDRVSIDSNELHYLKQRSHLIDWNEYTDDFGMTLHQTNFTYALVGVLIGFVFLFFFIYAIMGV